MSEDKKHSAGAMRAAEKIQSVLDRTCSAMGLPPCPDDMRDEIIAKHADIIDDETSHYPLLEALKKAEKALDSVWASLADKAMPRTRDQIVKDVADINVAIANAEATE